MANFEKTQFMDGPFGFSAYFDPLKYTLNPRIFSLFSADTTVQTQNQDTYFDKLQSFS